MAVDHKLVGRRLVAGDIGFVGLVDLAARTLDFVRIAAVAVGRIEAVAECREWNLVLDILRLLEVIDEIGSLHIQAGHLVVG